jgi:galactan 5-O-arabinofuranosyltransferase
MTSTESPDLSTAELPPRDPGVFADLAEDRPVRSENALRVSAELIAAVLVAALVSLAVQWLIDRWHVPLPSYSPMAVATVACAVLVLVAVLLALRDRSGPLATVLSWSVLSTLVTAVLSLMLTGTRYYLSGVAGDNLFRTEDVTRFADTTANVDFAYVDMPSYYPRGWFWLAGRFAHVLDRPGWLAIKPFSILTMAVGTVLAYVVWRRLVRPGLALLTSLTVAAAAATTWSAAEPYAWLFGAMIPPLAVLAWRYLVSDARRPRPDGAARTTAAVLLGGTLGLLALFYTLLWLFLIQVLVMAALIGLASARRDREPLRPVLLRLLARLGLIALISLPFTLLQWAPYLWFLARHPVDVGGSLTYLPQSAAVFPIFHYPVNFTGVLALIGLLWCFVRFRECVSARGLLLVVAAGYLYYAVSLAGALINLTLMPYKVELVMQEALGCAGVFGLVDLAGVARRRLHQRWRAGTLAAVAALSVLGLVGTLQAAPGALQQLVSDAYGSYYPSGYTPLGARDETQPGAWNQQLHDAIARLTGKPEHDLVVLSTYQDFLSFWPYWNFEATKIEYSNYLGEYNVRRTTVESWARSGSAAGLLAALRAAPFRAPDVFVFTVRPDGLHLQVSRNVFPSSLDNVFYDVVFPTALFDSPAFARTTVGPYTVYARR